MSADGDPPRPTPAMDHDDPDALVGFCTPGSLGARPVERPVQPDPTPEPVVATPPAAERPVAEPTPSPRIEPVMSAPAPTPEPAPGFAAAPAPAPTRAVFGRSTRFVDEPVAPMSLYTLYALILFAVPTFGASAAIGLLAVTGRAPPADPLAASHFVYQQRSLWAAAIAAVAGAILIVVGLGVFVLFIAAVWLLARGAAGVWALKGHRPIRDPRGWGISFS